MIKSIAALSLLSLPAVLAAQSISTPTYLMKAGASDMFEVRSAKVMASSTNPKIRGFATMMIKDHTQSTADVKQATTRARLNPSPPKLTPKQTRELAALGSANGSARDRLYIDQQKTAHSEALAVQQGYANDGKVATLKAAATKIVPVVQHHIDVLNTM